MSSSSSSWSGTGNHNDAVTAPEINRTPVRTPVQSPPSSPPVQSPPSSPSSSGTTEDTLAYLVMNPPGRFNILYKLLKDYGHNNKMIITELKRLPASAINVNCNTDINGIKFLQIKRVVRLLKTDPTHTRFNYTNDQLKRMNYKLDDYIDILDDLSNLCNDAGNNTELGGGGRSRRRRLRLRRHRTLRKNTRRH